jgi:hypothetical protein
LSAAINQRRDVKGALSTFADETRQYENGADEQIRIVYFAVSQYSAARLLIARQTRFDRITYTWGVEIRKSPLAPKYLR